MNRTIRAACAQFAVATNVDENLATCLRAIDEAAMEHPDLLVLPEFLNHLSWYDGPDHLAQVSVDEDGPFLTALAAKARAHKLHLVANVTVRRGGGVVTGTSFLFGLDGQVLAQSDKQVLIGHENDFLRPAQRQSPVVATALGRIGLYACMDGVICETARGLALAGADILCNSLNSFALDEASLHVPVRAAENHVFVVAANKVGPLIPAAMLEPVSQAVNIPARFLHGAGESQIVAPDGTVLAKAPASGDAIIVAELTPAAARDKRRPDGTDRFAARRPALYAPIAKDPHADAAPAACAETLVAAVIQPGGDDTAVIAEAAAHVAEAASRGARLIVLPELFCFEHGRVFDLASAANRSRAAIDRLARALPEGAHAVTSLAVEHGGRMRHAAVLIGPSGVVAQRAQVHASERHAWATPGDDLSPVPLPWGRLGLVTSDDSVQPETFRLLAIAGAEVCAVPLAPLEAWELGLGLVERAAENRMCLVAAARPGPLGSSLIATLDRDFTIMTPWQERKFDGLLSHPRLVHADAAARVTTAAVHPGNAHNKVVSHRTHLVANRPFALAGRIVSPVPVSEEAAHV
jgi:predicted amidohydrolase